MSECQPDEWIEGLWFVVSGLVLSVSGFVSVFAVLPVMRD